ncbi:hypothetical protein [Clostridium sp. AF32-12BH]|uniref:hypothetical protein n=1 Tax=Clostridium sp. AF32-12BH TaxID=2292006 RepID=UPI000E52CA1E|nr:hypothetical protein [Clostridium sp. AF32-12BH]RHP46914.1 hypothetical protein DWZ40_08390 [Clostridium sp. AF32-12BH]
MKHEFQKIEKKVIAMLFSEVQKQIGTWAFLECRPTGKIMTREQYNYVKYYTEHTSIDGCRLKTFEEAKGKYLCLGNWFGGAAFYFHLKDEPEGIWKHRIVDKVGAVVGYSKYYEDFSYGQFGKIEFTEREMEK